MELCGLGEGGRAALAGFLRRDLSAPVALMRMGWDAGEGLAAALADSACADPRLSELARLAAGTPGLATIARLRAAGVAHDVAADARALFDAAAGVDPDAASAAYALGDPALLADATDELLAVIGMWAGPLAGVHVLDLGCGSGRLTAALAGAGAFAVGADLSAGMLAAARARAAAGTLVQTGADAPACFASSAFNLAILSDVMPYARLHGLERAAALLASTARVLRPGGRLLLFNWSYDGSPERDRAEAASAAAAAGLASEREARRPFRLWDATGWSLLRC
jgi:SAM-dependent methyltransferase